MAKMKAFLIDEENNFYFHTNSKDIRRRGLRMILTEVERKKILDFMFKTLRKRNK